MKTIHHMKGEYGDPAECYAEDCRIGDAEDYGTPPNGTFMQQVGPGALYEDSLDTLFPVTRDCGEWEQGVLYLRGDIVIWQTEKWVCSTSMVCEVASWVYDTPPGNSTYWDKVTERSN